MMLWTFFFLLTPSICCGIIPCTEENANNDYSTKHCRLDENLAYNGSCRIDPKIFVDKMKLGRVILEFDILSNSCDIEYYEFKIYRRKNLIEGNCNLNESFFIGDSHWRPRTIHINYDEKNEYCGKTETVVFEDVYDGCYRFEYFMNQKSNSTRDEKVMFINTTLKKEQHCNQMYITPSAITQNAMQLIMKNFSKFKILHGLITKPEGDNICNGDTTDEITKFEWKVRRDESGKLLCTMASKIKDKRIECLETNQTIECTFYNLVPGNYCYYVQPSDGVCHSEENNVAFYADFTISTVPTIGVSVSKRNSIYIITIIVFSCLIVLCIIALIYIGHKKRGSISGPDNYKMNYKFPQKSKVLLLYSRDCDPFMKLMVTFRNMLKEMTTCKVYDCYDHLLSEEVGGNKCDWMRNLILSDDIKVVVVESSCATLHQRTLRHHVRVRYAKPAWLDDLFLFGLKALTDDVTRNTYHNICVVRIDGFTEENSLLTYLTPYTRYIIPQHLKNLLLELDPQKYLNILPHFDDNDDGNYKEFQQDLKNLVMYKKQEPLYLENLLSGV